MNHKRIFTIGSFIILLNSCGIGDDYKQESHREFLKLHEYSVGQSTLEFNDSKRKRPVKTEIWYPTRDTTQLNVTTEYPFKLPPTSKDADIIPGKFPLILLSHGTGGNRFSQMWLACELASAGYIVMAVNHYGNTLDNKIPENFVKVWDRPLDMSFALDMALKDSMWGTKIDTNRIGMAGFSLGGYTTIALAGGILDYSALKEFSNTKEGKNEFDLPELGDVSQLMTSEIIETGNKDYKHLKDDRITVFVAMAPALGQGFKQRSQFAGINDPVLIIGAESDQRTPIHTNAKHYHKLIEGSEYIELEGKTGHYIFMNEAKSSLKRNASMIFEDHPTINRNDAHKKVSKMILGFFEEKLKERTIDN